MVNYVSDQSRERAERVVRNIQAAGSKAILCQANVSDVNDLSKLVDAALTLSTTGKIEILIHK